MNVIGDSYPLTTCWEEPEHSTPPHSSRTQTLVLWVSTIRIVPEAFLQSLTRNLGEKRKGADHFKLLNTFWTYVLVWNSFKQVSHWLPTPSGINLSESHELCLKLVAVFQYNPWEVDTSSVVWIWLFLRAHPFKKWKVLKQINHILPTQASN